MHQVGLQDWDERDEITHHPHDLMLDPWATLGETSLTGPTLETIELVLKAIAPSGKKPRSDVTRGVSKVVPTLMANLLLLHCDRPSGSRLIVSMRHEPKTRYTRPGFRKLPEIINAMADLGLLIKHDAVFKQRRTTIEATGPLKTVLLTPQVSAADVMRAEGEETILLATRPVPQRIHGIKQPNVPVDYEDTEETFGLRREIDALNRFLSIHKVTLEGEPKPAIRLFRKFTLRKPTDAIEFQMHGRIYGGFWMNMKASERYRIRIDDEPIADLDYSNMFPRLAYWEVGREPPEGDLYAIPGLENHRNGAKAGLSALLSYRSKMKSLPHRLKELLPEGWTAKRLKQAIADFHPHLVSHFEKDFGLDLMFTESRILLRAMGRLMAEDIPALPMHDGMMVPKSKAAIAKQAMNEASSLMPGLKLPVSLKS